VHAGSLASTYVQCREYKLTNRVEVEISGHIAAVKLNRPAKRNAVDLAMFRELTEAAARLKSDSAVRAVVLYGEGASFCAGIDISVFQGEGIGAVGGDLMQAREDSPANFFQSAAYAWHELAVPVVAALHGTVFGAGLQIALGADIRYATPDAKMSIMEIKWGIIPDMGISVLLRNIVATDKVRELAYTGRVFSGTEAAEIGLVTSVCDDPKSKALSVAAEIASKSPDAIRAIKKLINESWQKDHGGALRHEAELQRALMGGANQVEAVSANMNNRAALFTDPDS